MASLTTAQKTQPFRVNIAVFCACIMQYQNSVLLRFNGESVINRFMVLQIEHKVQPCNNMGRLTTSNVANHGNPGLSQLRMLRERQA
ncbi:hypothetical protein G210_0944 [Candida maltosa Xu316]|uniref:Uncharacterized protein n=1 Tax=Candida maltosa (strain Xu316) TaxID=1245528 RepID=M3JZP0_CANMX|nr:hypothetical protein G210_0944 [Candida maltosa Xu316]